MIAIGFVLVFKAQLSGAKFYVVAELRAPTTDLCDLGLSVDPGTVFVSLYFAQVLRESCLSKYRKLIDTLPQHCDKTGLDLQQVDLTLMLLRSLPSDVKNYVFLHASGEGVACVRSILTTAQQP